MTMFMFFLNPYIFANKSQSFFSVVTLNFEVIITCFFSPDKL